MITVLVKRVHKDAQLPVKGSAEAACFDLHAAQAVEEADGWTVHTGLAVALPEGYAMLIYPRSGLATNSGLTLRNTTGIIDSDYRGEIILKFSKGFPHAQRAIRDIFDNRGRVAQAMILQVPEVNMVEAEELPDTVRGTGGFGSTGT